MKVNVTHERSVHAEVNAAEMACVEAEREVLADAAPAPRNLDLPLADHAEAHLVELVLGDRVLDVAQILYFWFLRLRKEQLCVQRGEGARGRSLSRFPTQS